MSTDGTFELLRDLSRTLPITVLSDTTKPFYQGAKVTWLSRVAWLSGARWIIPFDADERWFAPGESLREFFTRNTHPIVAATIHNFYPTDDDSDTWRMQVRPHPLTQVAYRSHPLIEAQDGNHHVALPGFPVSEPGLYMAHFPWRSMEQLRRKVQQGAERIRMTNLGEGIDGHWWQMADTIDTRVEQTWNCILGRQDVDFDFGYKPVGELTAVPVLDWQTWPEEFTPMDEGRNSGYTSDPH